MSWPAIRTDVIVWHQSLCAGKCASSTVCCRYVDAEHQISPYGHIECFIEFLKAVCQSFCLRLVRYHIILPKLDSPAEQHEKVLRCPQCVLNAPYLLRHPLRGLSFIRLLMHHGRRCFLSTGVQSDGVNVSSPCGAADTHRPGKRSLDITRLGGAVDSRLHLVDGAYIFFFARARTTSTRLSPPVTLPAQTLRV